MLNNLLFLGTIKSFSDIIKRMCFHFIIIRLIVLNNNNAKSADLSLSVCPYVFKK